MGGVQLSPNIKKTSQRIDPNGNIIDPKTRQILVPVEQDYVPPVKVEKSLTINSQDENHPMVKAIESYKEVTSKLETLSDIKIAIKKVETQLSELRDLKRKKVEEMRKELEEAE